MMSDKVFVFLPDGIGLRNFAYSDFFETGKSKGFETVYWNNTAVAVSQLGLPEIGMQGAKMHPMTYMYKAARKDIELTLNIRKTNDDVYETYRFPLPPGGVRQRIKNTYTRFLIATHSSESGLQKIKAKIDRAERRTDTYKKSIETLRREKPALVFLTNQRQVIAISSILAAKDLRIPTATFIFSWDNLPKATMVVETDYYIVWSELMKEQLLFYYPEITPEQIFITGTPQFESHFDPKIIEPRESFLGRYNLDPNRKYICFSGDDITTSPDDPAYLNDTALAIESLNQKGYNLGIIFRRCPPDVSRRYDQVLARHSHLITAIEPQWKPMGETWFSVVPMPEDVALLSNTIAHTEAVVNFGSSMVFDYASFDKPCGYFNYDQAVQNDPSWRAARSYRYVHFRSMPSKNVVHWLNSKDSLASEIEKMITGAESPVAQAKRWFEIVNRHPPEFASARIWDAFEKIIAASKTV